MMELSPSSSFCPGTFPPTTNFFLFNRTIPPVHINNLNNQTKPPVHINNLRVNQGCPMPAKRVGLIKKIQIQNKQPHLGAKQGIAPADYTISNQNTLDDLLLATRLTTMEDTVLGVPFSYVWNFTGTRCC